MAGKTPKRRGQRIERAEGVHLLRVPLHRDPKTGKRTYHNETFHGTAAKAEKRLTALLAEVDDGSFFQPSKMSVGELLDRWLKAAQRRDIRGVTYDCYERTARAYIRPELEALPLARLTPLVVQDFFDSLVDRKLAPLTIRNIRSVFADAMKYAHKLRLVKENPLTDVETPKAKRRPVRGMTEDEAARFVEHARRSDRGLLFLLWLHTGLRPAEFIGLRWSAVELMEDGERAYGVLHVRETVVRQKGGGWIFSPPKTEKGKRPVYFPAWLYHDLAAHRRAQALKARQYGGTYEDHGFVFAARNGQPMLRHNIAKRYLKPLLKEAGLPEEFTLYTLRRSFASLLRRAGVSAKEVSEQMGHERSSFTDDVYVTVYDSARREMSDRLENIISKGSCTQDAHSDSEQVM